MNPSKTVIISPSGNFYGSEQVLFDFLTETKQVYRVYLPSKGRLIENLTQQGRHRTEPVTDFRRFYIRLFFLLSFGLVRKVYVNEGGHIKYIKLLAKIFRGAEFIIHIRIMEDTDKNRIGNLTSNITLVSISEYVSSFLSPQYKSATITIYDPYISREAQRSFKVFEQKKIRVGVIGRVTETKGVKDLEAFCDFLEEKAAGNIGIDMYGDIEKDNQHVASFLVKAKRYQHLVIRFHGFVDNKAVMYESLDIVLHLSRTEPLGRIFFESLDYGVPFIGFKSGGIGEIASVCGLRDHMIEPGSNWKQDALEKIMKADRYIEDYKLARQAMMHHFAAETYCRAIENIIL